MQLGNLVFISGMPFDCILLTTLLPIFLLIALLLLRYALRDTFPEVQMKNPCILPKKQMHHN